MSSENNYSNLNANYEQLHGEHKKLQKTLEDLSKQLNEALDRIHDLENTLAASEVRGGDLTTRLEATTEENNNNRRYYNDATRKLNDSREGEAHLQAELGAC